MLWLFDVRTQRALRQIALNIRKTVTGTGTAAKLRRQINGILKCLSLSIELDIE